jgi:hypothetical protein
MEPEESVAFASLVNFYNGRHAVCYNGRILCARVAPASIKAYRMKVRLTGVPIPDHFPFPHLLYEDE